MIAFFANGMGMIKVYRKQDLPSTDAAPGGVSRHHKMFEAVENTFLRGENILIFPEGKSHDFPYVLDLRSGGARMLLETEGHAQFALGLSWLPISLDVEDKTRPGSRILLHYHPARPIAKYRALYEKNPEEAINALRNEMSEVMREITLNFRNWEERLFIERLTHLWLLQAPSHLMLHRHNTLLKWKRIVETTDPVHMTEWQELKDAVDDIGTQLDWMGLPMEDLERVLKSKKSFRYRLFTFLTFWGPCTLAGRIAWWVPNKIVTTITNNSMDTMGRDTITSYHVVAGMVLYPLWAIGILFSFAFFLSWTMAAKLLFVAIALGFINLVTLKRVKFRFKKFWSLYRTHAYNDFRSELESEVKKVCEAAAKLWNASLESTT